MSLLDEKKTAPKKLIEEIGAEKDDNTVEPVSDEGPSMMEMMMAAQLEAKNADDAVKERERDKQSKAFGGGFKKGFFGGGSSSKSAHKKAASSSNSITTKKEVAPPIPPSSTEAAIPTITKKAANSLVMDDVQQAMREEANPLLEKVKQGGAFNCDNSHN
jgi:hypothetical protein